MKQARKEAVRRRRRIIYNDDNVDAQTKTPKEFIAARLQHTVGTQVDVVTFDPFSVDNIAIYPSKVVEVDTGHYPLFVAGHDPVALALKFCHDHNIEFYPSFRMNDVHESRHKNWERTAAWKREHPEYLLGRHGDNSRYPSSSPRAWWAAKNYEVREVRERQLLVIQEVCEKYDVDGIELDWFRSPLFFRPTLDLKSVGPRHLTIMNDFLRRTRAMTEQIATKRGRPLLIACRVPLSVERCRAIGLDIRTWLQDDLVDLLIVGGGYAPMAMAQSVRQMVTYAGKYDVPVYACISASGMKGQHGHNNIESWRGAAMNIHHAGAGVYVFNLPYGLTPPGVDRSFHRHHSSPEQVQLYNQLGSLATLKGLDKIYGVDYIVEKTFEGDLRPGLVVSGRLPIELKAGVRTKVCLPVGEDITANAPKGRTTHARLRLRPSEMGLGDELCVYFNSQSLSLAAPAKSSRAVRRANLLSNAAFEKGMEFGKNAPEWRGSGYNGSRHIDAKFVLSPAGRGGSRGALLEVEPEHAWALADQHTPVQMDFAQAAEFSVWLRAEKPRTCVHLVLCLHLPKQNLYDVAQARSQFAIGTEWKEYRSLLDVGSARSLPASLKDATIRAIIQVYQPGPVKLYVDDANLAIGPTPQVEFDLNPNLVRVGDNVVELELAGQRIGSGVVLERLDLIVTY